MNYQITRIGLGVIGLVLVGGFATIGGLQYETTQQIKTVQEQVTMKPTPIIKIVTPTVMPTATPSAVTKPVVRTIVPAEANNTVKEPVTTEVGK